MNLIVGNLYYMCYISHTTNQIYALDLYTNKNGELDSDNSLSIKEPVMFLFTKTRSYFLATKKYDHHFILYKSKIYSVFAEDATISLKPF